MTVDEILQTAAERTGAAAAGRRVLLIEDTSEINYEARARRKRGLGRVGDGADVGLFVHPATTLAEAAWIVELYRRRWIIEQLFRTLKSQGLDLEDSLLSDGEALERLAAAALIAAASVMPLVQGRGEAGATLSATRVFAPAEISVLEPLVRKLEGKTAKQKNPYPKHSLAWAS